jgi:hypothetical protein
LRSNKKDKKLRFQRREIEDSGLSMGLSFSPACGYGHRAQMMSIQLSKADLVVKGDLLRCGCDFRPIRAQLTGLLAVGFF